MLRYSALTIGPSSNIAVCKAKSSSNKSCHGKYLDFNVLSETCPCMASNHSPLQEKKNSWTSVKVKGMWPCEVTSPLLSGYPEALHSPASTIALPFLLVVSYFCMFPLWTRNKGLSDLSMAAPEQAKLNPGHTVTQSAQLSSNRGWVGGYTAC